MNLLISIAHGLGFKYIWHRGGRFLVKRRDGEKTLSFMSAEDLHALSHLYEDSEDQKTAVSKTNHDENVDAEALFNAVTNATPVSHSTRDMGNARN